MLKYNDYGMQESTYNQFFLDKYIPLDIKKEYINIVESLSIYTMIYDKNIEVDYDESLIERLKQFNLERITFNKIENKYEFIDENEHFFFEILSSKYDLFKKYKNILESPDREKKCHINCFKLTLLFKNCKILTGYYVGGNYSALHSVLLLEDGKILDSTRNIVMEKEDYFRIYQFNPICEIDKYDFESDIELLQELKFLSLKLYMSFRDELIYDLSRNEKLIKK